MFSQERYAKNRPILEHRLHLVVHVKLVADIARFTWAWDFVLCKCITNHTSKYEQRILRRMAYSRRSHDS
jgi:hypothetical protein